MPLRWTAAGLVPDFSDSSSDEGGGKREDFCEVCADLDRNIVAPWTRSGKHYFSIPDIRPSALKAQDGICYTCTIIGNGLTQFREGWANTDDKLCINITGYDDSSMPLLVHFAKVGRSDPDNDDDDDEGKNEDVAAEDNETETKLSDEGNNKPPSITTTPAEIVMEFYADSEEEPLPWPAIGPSCHIYDDPTHDEVFKMISKWINECRKDHALCQPNPDVTLNLPSRVIHVGSDECLPRLYISNGELEPYAALSHCWGPIQPLKTTSKTISSHTEGIAWDQLPKTFREAIIITRKLGLEYLWIDSLCIIQDDAHDWEIESAKMGSVYKNSYVTISSTGFPNSRGGLLNDRKTAILDLEGNTIYARQYLDHEQFSSSGSSSRSASNQYPLFTRGWCFQERLLATRLLHYTPQGVFFECNCSARCECQGDCEDRALQSFKRTFAPSIEEDPNATPDTTADTETDGLNDDNDDDDDDDNDDDDDDDEWSDVDPDDDLDDDLDDDPATLWNEIVTNYARKKLTFQTDVLVALSSIASEWQKRGMGKYLAGLWEDSLAAGLLWKSVKTIPVNFESDDYLAPTFSWASRVGPITPYEPSKQPTYHIKVLETECVPKGPNLFGQVTDGFIRLSGPLIEAKFHPESCSDCSTMFWQKLNGGCHLKKSGYDAEYFNIDRSADAEMKKGRIVYLLLIATTESSGNAIASANNGKNDDVSRGRRKAMVSHSAALVLQRSDGRNRYKRIGAAHDICDGWFKGAVEKEVIII